MPLLWEGFFVSFQVKSIIQNEISSLIKLSQNFLIKFGENKKQNL
jgi:hypothetical protein